MSTVTHPGPESERAPSRARGRWLIAFVAVVVVALAAAGTWVITEADQPDDLATATEIIDAYVTSVVASDPDAFAALFTKDGIYDCPYGFTYHGQDEIRDVAEWATPMVTYGERLGTGTATEAGVVFPMGLEFDGDRFRGDVRVTLEGDRAAHIEWLSRTPDNA